MDEEASNPKPSTQLTVTQTTMLTTTLTEAVCGRHSQHFTYRNFPLDTLQTKSLRLLKVKVLRGRSKKEMNRIKTNLSKKLDVIF